MATRGAGMTSPEPMAERLLGVTDDSRAGVLCRWSWMTGKRRARWRSLKHSLAENDEERRRAHGRARIALKKGFWRDLKGEEKQAAESSQKGSALPSSRL